MPEFDFEFEFDFDFDSERRRSQPDGTLNSTKLRSRPEHRRLLTHIFNSAEAQLRFLFFFFRSQQVDKTCAPATSEECVRVCEQCSVAEHALALSM